MRHARSDYDAIQPWPTKRAHNGKVVEDEQFGTKLYLGLTDDALEQLGGEAGVEPIIPDDEPVFLIRGQDLAAIPAAEAWCVAALELGTDLEVIDCVRRHIEVVREWQQTHAKVPDAPAEVLR